MSRCRTARLALWLAACKFHNGGGTSDASIADAPINDVGAIDATWCALPDLSLYVATLAGCDVAGDIDGPRAATRFANPVNVVLGPSGEAYVADYGNNAVRKID